MSSVWPYCGHHASMEPYFANNTLSQCFLETTVSTVSFGWMFIIGGVFTMASRAEGLTTSLAAHKFRFALSALMCLSYLVHLVVRSVLDHSVTQYILVADNLYMYGWITSLVTLRSRLKNKKGDSAGWILNVFWLFFVVHNTLQLISLNEKSYIFQSGTSQAKVDLAMFVFRSFVLVLLVFSQFYWGWLGRRSSSYRLIDSKIEESSINGRPNGKNLGDQGLQKRTETVFKDLAFTLKRVWPLIWPKGNMRLQSLIYVSVVLLVAGRVVNLYVPLYYKKLVDDLTGATSTSTVPFPVSDILMYCFLRFLQGGGTGSMGLINTIKSVIWVPIQQFTDRAAQTKLFNHLHSLSLRWHLGRKTGEVIRVMDRGTDSIDTVLNTVVFSILPTLVDIAIAIVYFTVAFGSYFGLVVFATMALYIIFTIVVTEWRTVFRREMNLRDNKIRQTAVDSLLNFETVKYYNAERFEGDRFLTSVVDYQEFEWKSYTSLYFLNGGQNIIISVGLLGGSLLCGYLVHRAAMTVGDFVLYVAYILQLYVPLNWFGTYYQQLQQNFIDMENMLDMLDIEPEVTDRLGAKDLAIAPSDSCSIDFEHVSFYYDPARKILDDISFSVPAGQTYAIVGSTGSGKSTILRLLFRFYDLQEGRVLVNGQDISTVRQDSLRSVMGVVPQDTVLFNDTIKYNILYGRPTASEQEVYDAAKAAEIHNNILGFPKQYETVVGERGLKLSGGEKQRVAIARTILKNPKIVLLDEATSALDTHTERNIQAALTRMCASRTTLCIAHRLSTVVNANCILVLEGGRIVERGTHNDLLAMQGRYHAMWSQQQEEGDESFNSSLSSSALKSPSS